MKNPKKNWRLGEILVQQGWLTWQQLEAALEIQLQNKKKTDAEFLTEYGFVSKSIGQTLCLGEILIKNGWLTWKHLEDALDIQRETGRILGEILIEKKFISKENLYRGLAQQLHKPFVKLSELTIPLTVIQVVPRYLVLDYHIMPLMKQNEVLLIALSDFRDVRAEIELKKIIRDCEVRTVIAEPDDIKKAIAKYYP